MRLAGPSNPGACEPPRWLRRGIFAVIALALVVRLALGLLPMIRSRDSRIDDPDNYLTLARSLIQGEGLTWQGRPTAYRPPLYPIVLAPLVGCFPKPGGLRISVVVLHSVLGALTVAFTYVAACRWGLNPWRVLAAATIVALDPVLVAQSRGVMTETLAATLLAAVLAALAGPGAGARSRAVWLWVSRRSAGPACWPGPV